MNARRPTSPAGVASVARQGGAALRGACRALALLALLLVPCHRAIAQSKPAPAAAAAGHYAAFAKGRVEVAGGMVKLGTARDGIIQSVHAGDGTEVRKGALLMQLDDRQARLQLEAARNEVLDIDARMKPQQVKLAAAERELARVEPLVATQAVARAERDDKRDQVALIRAELDALRAQGAAALTRIKLAALEVELRALRAPADGRIIKRFARAGDSAQAAGNTPLFLFAPNTARVVRADLEERFLSQVAPGMPAEIVLEADESRVLKGRIERIGLAFGARPPSDDPAERADLRTVDMTIALDAAASTELLIGQRVLVRIAKGNRPASK